MRSLSLLLLTACAPTIIASTPRSVTLDHVQKRNIDEATAKAQAACERYDRDAEMIPDSVPDGVVTFKCVDRGKAAAPSDE